MKLDKAKLAEKWALEVIKFRDFNLMTDCELLAAKAWQYADAMQAEADKRVERGVPDVIKTEPKQKCDHHHFHWEEVSESEYICMGCGESPSDDSEYLGGLVEGVPEVIGGSVNQSKHKLLECMCVSGCCLECAKIITGETA